MPASGRVTFARSGGIHVLRYHGRVDYMLAPAIRRLTDGVIATGDVAGWVFDLSDADSLDSTNLGLLARTADRSPAAARRPVIVSTNDDITAVLRSMSFDDMFDIVTAAPTAPAGAEIALAAASPRELGETMLEAHRTLMELSEAGRLQFQDVVACLEAEVGKT